MSLVREVPMWQTWAARVRVTLALARVALVREIPMWQTWAARVRVTLAPRWRARRLQARRLRARAPPLRGRQPRECQPRECQPRECQPRGRQPRGRAHWGPRAQWRPLRVKRAALARIPASAAEILLARVRRPVGQARTAPTVGMRVSVASAWQVAIRSARAGLAREQWPYGTERGASSAPGAWPASQAPEARWGFPGGQTRPAKPPPAESQRRIHSHDRACDLGRPPARSEACA